MLVLMVLTLLILVTSALPVRFLYWELEPRARSPRLR
jgi:hypothetical protein